MRTLDEVIKAWSICFSDNSRSNCTGCPYADEDGDAACFNHDREDALHYLKMYRSDKLQWEADKKAYDDERQKAIHATKKARERYIVLAKDTKDELAVLRDYWAEQQANNPLTWDELKSMEGKPVWVEDNIDEPEDTTKYWAIYRRIDKAQETEYALLSDFYYDKAQYGKTWQAYRKERT